MKKIWKAPEMETLQLRMTADGALQWYAEGTIVFKPDGEGKDDIIHETHS